MTDRFVTPCELPTPHERELLTILAEECGEVVQATSKALRFGLLETKPGQPLTNATRLAHEIGDLAEVIERLVNAGVISAAEIEAGRRHKRINLDKYMQTEAP